MASIKTAISLQQSLFEQVDTLARELQVSRSRLFALAIEEVSPTWKGDVENVKQR